MRLFNLSVILSLDNRNVQFCLHRCFSNFFFRFTIFSFLFTHCTLVFVQALHCLPVTMWTYLSQRWNRANTSSFFVILESLNALSTFYVYFLFPLVTLQSFVLLCILKENPAEGKVLSCENWMKKRRCRVFNLSCLIVWLTFYDSALCTCLFWKEKVH